MLRHTASLPRHPGIRNSTTLFASYYTPTNQLISTPTAAVTADRLYGALYEQMSGAVANRAALEITTGAVGAARLGLYHHDYATGHWGARLLDIGTVDTGSIALVEASFTAMALPDMFWIVSVFNATPTCRAAAQDNSSRFGNTTLTSATGGRGIHTALIYAALPAALDVPSAYSTNTPAMALRYVG